MNPWTVHICRPFNVAMIASWAGSCLILPRVLSGILQHLVQAHCCILPPIQACKLLGEICTPYVMQLLPEASWSWRILRQMCCRSLGHSSFRMPYRVESVQCPRQETMYWLSSGLPLQVHANVCSGLTLPLGENRKVHTALGVLLRSLSCKLLHGFSSNFPLVFGLNGFDYCHFCLCWLSSREPLFQQ